MPTISDRVLAYLKKHPSTATEVAKALPLKRRHTRFGYTYHWGDWSFHRAEMAGLIECDVAGRWYLKETQG